ncbi:MAG: MATE family efflux transporter, partial [Mangrovicoccus sp.]
LSNATVPILGAVDTGVVGQMGAAAPIGAVGIGAAILSAIYWIFGFLRMGTTGLAAQALGAGDKGEFVALLTRALMIAAVAGLGTILFQMAIFWGAFWVIPASDEVETLARSYLAIRIWSAPAAIAIYGVTGWLIAAERSRAVLVLQLWMNGLNILLDLWFVIGLGWGVEGVAFATFLAEWSGLALGLWFCRAAFADQAWRAWAKVFDRARLWHMAAINSHILLRSALLQSLILSFMVLGARFGDVPLAANQILLQFLMIASYALDGFAYAGETLVGQAVGRRNRAEFRQAAWISGLWGGIMAVVMTLAYALSSGLIIDAMTNAPEVREAARTYVTWVVFLPIVSVAAWMLDGVFIGATRTRDMANMMVISIGLYFAALPILLPAFGNHGLWAALLIGFAARGATLAWKYPGLERSVA